MYITIFTPTYNRCHCLSRLYDSIIKQASKYLEWVIVDDGSTDETREIIDLWISENKVSIKYIYQKNHGKYVAHNTGVKYSRGDVFFCIDDDDTLAPNAIEIIRNEWLFIKNDNSLSGIIAYKKDTSGKLTDKEFPPKMDILSLHELTRKYRIAGDRALVYKTSILKQFLFPEIENVKFITEAAIYREIDRYYSMKLVRETLSIVDYRDDGYTKNILSVISKNAIGCKYGYMKLIDMEYHLDYHIQTIIYYNICSILADDGRYTYDGKYNYLVKILYPISMLGAIILKLIVSFKREKFCNRYG